MVSAIAVPSAGWQLGDSSGAAPTVVISEPKLADALTGCASALTGSDTVGPARRIHHLGWPRTRQQHYPRNVVEVLSQLPANGEVSSFLPRHDPMEPDGILIAQDLYSLLQHWILEGPAVRPRVLEKAGERVQIVAYGYFADLVFIPPPGHLVLNQAGVHSVERRMFEKPFQAGQAATDTLPCVWALAIFLFALQHEMNGGWCGSETPAYCNQPDLTTPYRPKNRPSSGPTEPSGKRRRGRGGTGIPNRSCQLRQESVPGVAPTTSRTGTLPKT